MESRPKYLLTLLVMLLTVQLLDLNVDSNVFFVTFVAFVCSCAHMSK